ncbi:MAG: GDP-fucose synthetase [Lasallia pustulata]|uniref:GDP-mannose 4,6-dehydratase n=1 Tax=Lasallia pustulata TaxID=136370 RepID=A0A5M8PDQ3_9LECA|nr:MAG: GDP-fucose synthetase [Lasallia pustulata]
MSGLVRHPRIHRRRDRLGTVRILEAIRKSASRPATTRPGRPKCTAWCRKCRSAKRRRFTRAPYGAAKMYAHWITVNYRESYGMFACNGILFNHESPGAAKLCHSQDHAGRRPDQGRHAGQLKNPTIMWSRPEKPIRSRVPGRSFLARRHEWKDYVEFDARYERPAEVDLLIGDASKAKAKLGWEPRTTFHDLVRLMVDEEIASLGQSESWPETRVVVTGGAGFLGSFVVDKLGARLQDDYRPASADYDLRDATTLSACTKKRGPMSSCISRRSSAGSAQPGQPGRFFYDNAIMGIQLIEYARQMGVQKRAVERLPGRNQCALRAGEKDDAGSDAGVRQQYGFNGIFLLPCAEAKAAGRSEIVLWGDGTPTREFLYVEDAAEGLLRAAESYNGDQPVNLGTGEEIHIKDLATVIAAEVGFSGEIVWDTTKPNGQPRRCLMMCRGRRTVRLRGPEHASAGHRQDWRLVQPA